MRFLLVDRIVDLERGKRATGIKNVTLSEDYLTHHFPDYPIMPGALIVESLVQLADWVVRESSNFERMGLAVAFDRMKFRHMVRPGDQLRLEVEIVEIRGDEFEVRGRARCADAVVTTVDFTLRVQALEPLHTVEEARRVFRMIRGEARE